MKNKFDIIITGIQPWDFATEGNCLNIAKTFAKNNKVLYINYPLDRATLLRERESEIVINRLAVINNEKPALEKVSERLWVYTPPLILHSINWMPTPIFKVFNRLNSRKFGKYIRDISEDLGFKHVMLFCDSDMYRSISLQKILKPNIFIYYTRDNLMTVPYWYKHGNKIEPQIMRKSDLVVANSTYLASLAKKNNPNSYYVGQGCDLSNFTREGKEVPEDLKKIPGLKIGYIGLLTVRRLNIDLLTEIAQKKPEWQIILVGPEEEIFKLSKLHRMDNVHFLGSKKTEELPSYIKHFDICINPQLLNDLTIGNYPRKIDEYLAMGKPVVATETPAMSIFSDHVYLGKTSQDYIELIAQAIRENSEEKALKRISLAKSHTWENNVKAIEDAVQNTQESNILDPKKKSNMSYKKLLRSLQINFPKQQDFISRIKQSGLNMFKKPHEEAFNALQLFEAQNDRLFVDIGSNRGQSINSMRLFADKETRIIAFEANPELSKKLLKKYDQDRSIKIYNYGLSSADGYLDLYIPFYKKWMFDGLASFNHSAASGWLKSNILFYQEELLEIKNIKCELKKLDDFNLEPYFIKIDVENYEEEVIKGGTKTIKEHLPILLIESLPKSSAHLLTDLGYEFFVFKDNRFIPSDPSYNTFCLNKSKHGYIINKGV
jgi:FkbM family methyltransferase